MENENKAIAIPQRHKVSCDICMLLDSDNKNMKFFLYDEGYAEDQDKYVCEDCVNGLKELRKKCHQKVDNPAHKVLDNWMPWFAKEVPGLIEAFKKQMP